MGRVTEEEEEEGGRGLEAWEVEGWEVGGEGVPVCEAEGLGEGSSTFTVEMLPTGDIKWFNTLCIPMESIETDYS